MNRKDIFTTGFKSKLGFAFTRKDMEEFETIIDFYEKENARLKDKIDESIEYIRDCCDMDSKWVNLHYDYAQKEMSSNEVDGLLEILKEN